MVRCVSALVLMFAAVGSARSADDDPLAKLKGAWVQRGFGSTPQGREAAEKYGLPPLDRGKTAALKIDGGKWTMTEGKLSVSGKLTAKAGEKYHEVELVINKGDKEEVKLLGLIHDYKDKDGVWELALNPPGQPRPEVPNKAAIRYIWQPAK